MVTRDEMREMMKDNFIEMTLFQCCCSKHFGKFGFYCSDGDIYFEPKPEPKECIGGLNGN